MSKELPQDIAVIGFNRYETAIHTANLSSAQSYARARGLPLAYFYADTQVMAEAIVTFWLLNQTEQRKVLADLKKRVFTEPKKPTKG
ncbi:XRE family transcriptional regulator [Lysobacter sp. 5GHs7-4]|uniref:XRE family transcriptional regulator n=1 Tax=Lysobacter sp. 5GHs7-4 TaxID=2904253 RepID=UPI001E3EAD25|nr:XRE family transcriptional regulator [Lysobacter sp. 5GHs7-4]UHQ23815.1 XRE family transcriptional regulator [Lysobacter sp. 5GHs7-4]